MAKKKNKESRLEKLLQIAQVMNLMNAPGQQAAAQAQQGQGQKIQALLGVLGLMQGDENADADRAMRGQQFAADDSFRQGRAASEDSYRTGEQQFRKERAGVEDTRYGETQQRQAERDSVSDFFAKAGLDLQGQQLGLQEKQLDATKRAQILQFVQDAANQPGANRNQVYIDSGDPELEKMGRAAHSRAIQPVFEQNYNEAGKLTGGKKTSFINSLPPELQSMFAAADGAKGMQMPFNLLPALFPGDKPKSVGEVQGPQMPSGVLQAALEPPLYSPKEPVAPLSAGNTRLSQALAELMKNPPPPKPKPTGSTSVVNWYR